MSRIARFLAVAAVATLTLAPVLAEARPGGSASSGSRGSRTYAAPPATNTAPTPARPMDRTMIEPGRPGATAGAATGAASAAARPAAAGGNFFQRNPLLGGLLAGGLIGAMLGGGFFSGLGSIAGMLGFLLQIALIGGLVFLLVTLLRRRNQPGVAMRQTGPAPAMAGLPRNMMPETGQMTATGGGMPASPPVTITAADQAAFGEALVAVNRAWSAGDTATLARITTPEMMQFFRDDYAALAARGWKNETSDLRLEAGDVSEAWNEGARDYCTVAMRFSLVDVTRSLADGAVVEGHPVNRQTVTEIWTFVRVQGGAWQLSAIQQTG
jgi:predicted lipid-binding transport protein (Tim44 family)